MATIRITATGLGDDSTALNDLIFKIYNGATDALIHTTGSHTTDANVTVTGTTVVITNVDVGTLGAGDTVKIAATDNDGTPLTGTLSASYVITSGDVTPPTLTSATIEDAAPTNVVMVFSESVTMTDLVDNGFTLSGTTSTVFTSISGSGTTWTGVLGTAAANGETITLSYSSVTGDVADASSNALATFSGTAVTNNIAASGGWSLSGASYDSISLSVSADDMQPTGVFFHPSGTKIFYIGNTNDRIYQKTLSTAWDITSGGATTFISAGSLGVTTGLAFSSDGTKLYYINQSASQIEQMVMSVALDVTTATTPTNVTTSVGGMIGLCFNAAGTKVYFTTNTASTVHEWNLSVAWDITTATAGTTLNTTAQMTGAYGIVLSTDGTKLFVTSESPDGTVYEYTLSTAGLISSGTYSGNSLVLTTQDANMRGLYIKPDGLKLWGSGITATASIYQYSLT